MKSLDEHILSLENFEGPIRLLLHLVQKNEVDICGIPLKDITSQYIQNLSNALKDSIDEGAEFIGTTASLLLLKSKALLPQYDEESNPLEEELDPRFDIIHYLLDYCRFKSAADEFKNREEKQAGYHVRGMSEQPQVLQSLGAGQLSLSELCSLFQQVLAKAPASANIIYEEKWKVSDKIPWILEQLDAKQEVLFHMFFTSTMCRSELIVTFLAVLELMKQGKLRIIKTVSDEIQFVKV